MKLNALIVEDEANSREILGNYLTKYCPDVHVVGEAASIKEAMVLLANNSPDLVFLDVEMPFGNALIFWISYQIAASKPYSLQPTTSMPWTP